MKITPISCRKLTAASIFASAAMFATSASAQVFAYEGFNAPTSSLLGGGAAFDGLTLTGISSTGTGFTGSSWGTTNGAGGASSYKSAGLSYPASYPGTHVAVGGHANIQGASGDNAFYGLDFDATADASINGASNIYMGWLAQNVATSTTVDGQLDAGTRSTFNLAAEYPRNSGVRINSVGGGSNNALGMFGNSGNWDGGGQSTYGDGELDPEIVDTWGAFNFNDANNIFTGNAGGTGPYNPAPANYDGVDHLVLSIDTAGGAYTLMVNPQTDGSSDGEISFVHTDGGPAIPFVMKALGLEAGNDSSQRAVGNLDFDEFYIGGDFASVAGFSIVPEPSAAGFIFGIFGLGLALVRRRR